MSTRCSRILFMSLKCLLAFQLLLKRCCFLFKHRACRSVYFSFDEQQYSRLLKLSYDLALFFYLICRYYEKY